MSKKKTKDEVWADLEIGLKTHAPEGFTTEQRDSILSSMKMIFKLGWDKAVENEYYDELAEKETLQ